MKIISLSILLNTLLLGYCNYLFSQNPVKKSWVSELFFSLDPINQSYDSLLQKVEEDTNFQVYDSVHELGEDGKDYYIGTFSKNDNVVYLGFQNELSILQRDNSIILSLALYYKHKNNWKKQSKLFVNKMQEEFGFCEKEIYKDGVRKGKIYKFINDKEAYNCIIIRENSRTDLKKGIFSLAITTEISRQIR